MFTYYDLYQYLYIDCNCCFYDRLYCKNDVCCTMYEVARSYIPVLIYI